MTYSDASPGRGRFFPDLSRGSTGVTAPSPQKRLSLTRRPKLPKFPSSIPSRASLPAPTSVPKTYGTEETNSMGLRDRETAEPGILLAQALRAKFPKHTAKQVARDINVKLETAKGWIAFDERMPQSNLLLKMFRKYGPKFAAAIDPDAEWAQLLQLEADIEETREALKASLRALGERE